MQRVDPQAPSPGPVDRYEGRLRSSQPCSEWRRPLHASARPTAPPVRPVDLARSPDSDRRCRGAVGITSQPTSRPSTRRRSRSVSSSLSRGSKLWGSALLSTAAGGQLQTLLPLSEAPEMEYLGVPRGHPTKLPRRLFLHLAAGAAALPVVPRVARAQAYPTRPIAMIVPASAGGPTDAIGRIMAQSMRVSRPIFHSSRSANHRSLAISAFSVRIGLTTS